MPMKSLLQKILAILARTAIRRYQPKIIGITGSVGKTSTREAIFSVLKRRYAVRKAEKNYNNEIGLPLTILGVRHYGKNIFGWLFALGQVSVGLCFRKKRYPEILILEYGISHPGDMNYLLSIAKPSVAVVTAIGDTPVHVEFFQDPEELIAEKAKLVEAVPLQDYTIMNHDDISIHDMKGKTSSHILTYGREEHADIKITNYKLQVAKDTKLGDVPEGISFKLEHDGNVVPVRLRKVFGLSQAYAAAAAAGVGMIMGMNLVEISEELKEYVSPPGRLRLLRGIKDSLILDDTYNASPESMRNALDTLNSLPARRKIVVLGDMLEIGKYTEQAHRAIGDEVAKFADMLLTVGPRAKFIADEAASRGIEGEARVMSQDRVLKFDDPIDAGRVLDQMIREGDLILVKGSQAMRMEKVVFEVMSEPQRADELLVRQDEYWKKW